MRAFLVCLLCCPAITMAQSQPLADVFEKVESSVVTVLTEGREVDVERSAGLASIAGIGSGVLISADGKVLTAAHVVQIADRVVVKFADGSRRLATVTSSDRLNDLALLQLKGKPPANAYVAKLADSDVVRVGERVLVVGAPHGMTHTLTVGHVSARRLPPRKVKTIFDVELFQTDAAINTGNSGGPMFDMSGDVVGIVSHIISESGGDEGLGFAVTSNAVKDLLLDAPAFWSGIDWVLVTEDLARILNLPEGRSGLLVQHVAAKSPAAGAGLRGGQHTATIDGEKFVIGGDIILEVDGIGVGEDESIERFRDHLHQLKPGAKLKVVVLRGGALETLEMAIDAQ